MGFLVCGFIGPGGMYMWLVAVLFVVGIIYGVKHIRALWSGTSAQQIAQKNKDKKTLLLLGNFMAVLGFLGTIVGIIMCLDRLYKVAKPHQITALVAGVSASLTSTAFGLMAAIGCWFLHVVIKNKERSIIG